MTSRPFSVPLREISSHDRAQRLEVATWCINAEIDNRITHKNGILMYHFIHEYERTAFILKFSHFIGWT